MEAGAGIPIFRVLSTGFLSAMVRRRKKQRLMGARNKKRTGNSGVNREEGEERRNSERQNSWEAGKSARLGRMHMSPDMCVTSGAREEREEEKQRIKFRHIVRRHKINPCHDH